MRNPKVLFLFPNSANEGVVPLAIAILSAIAKDIGCDVRYFETSFYHKRSTAGEERMRFGEFKPVRMEDPIELQPLECMSRDFANILTSFRPDILAVTANSLEYEIFCEIMEKTICPIARPFVIMGGCHATIAHDDVIKHPYVDAICIGEGEDTWKEFLQKYIKNQDTSSIKNLWIKTAKGIKKNLLRPLIGEDQLWNKPFDFSFFDNRHFLKPFDGKIRRRCLIELSRGCPYGCSYCVNSAFKATNRGLGKWFRTRPLESLKHGIKQLVEMGCEILQIQDECFFSIPIGILERFCRWYGDDIKLPLLLQTRPESITEDKVRLIAGTGVPVQITCGVESGSERILHEICNRRTKLSQIKAAFSIIKKYKLQSNAYTMIGFPTETYEEVFQTISLIREIKPDLSIMSVFYPFQGVPLRQYCLDKGYINGDEKARTFTDASILKNQPMSPEEITAIRRTYGLYIRLPDKYYSQVKLCEKDYENHKNLFNDLVKLSWELRK